MTASGIETAPAPPADAAGRARERWFRAVLLGLLVLVAGFTAILMANEFYPCVPASGSAIQPPLGECAIFLSPWIGIALIGAVLAGVGYLRVG